MKTDTYYIQIQGAQYDRINTQIKRIAAHLGHLQSEGHEEERARLMERRRHLVQERRRSQHYVEIRASDIPGNVHARPIYDLPGQIVTAEPQWYAELLGKLQKPDPTVIEADDKERRQSGA